MNLEKLTESAAAAAASEGKREDNGRRRGPSLPIDPLGPTGFNDKESQHKKWRQRVRVGSLLNIKVMVMEV